MSTNVRHAERCEGSDRVTLGTPFSARDSGGGADPSAVPQVVMRVRGLPGTTVRWHRLTVLGGRFPWSTCGTVGGKRHPMSRLQITIGVPTCKLCRSGTRSGGKVGHPAAGSRKPMRVAGGEAVACAAGCSGPLGKRFSYIGAANEAWKRLLRGWTCLQCPGCGLWTIWRPPESAMDVAAAKYAEENHPLTADQWGDDPEYHGRDRWKAMEDFRSGWSALRAGAQ